MKKIAIIDCRADDKTVYTLEKLNIKVIPTLKIDNLYDSVATHADIQIHYIGNNCFISAPETYEHYKKYMPKECTLIKGQNNIDSKYPYDPVIFLGHLFPFVPLLWLFRYQTL